MSDIVERLRDAYNARYIGESCANTHKRLHRDREEAADEIERLRAALKTARPFIGWAGHYPTILAGIDAALKEDGDA